MKKTIAGAMMLGMAMIATTACDVPEESEVDLEDAEVLGEAEQPICGAFLPYPSDETVDVFNGNQWSVVTTPTSYGEGECDVYTLRVIGGGSLHFFSGYVEAQASSVDSPTECDGTSVWARTQCKSTGGTWSNAEYASTSCSWNGTSCDCRVELDNGLYCTDLRITGQSHRFVGSPFSYRDNLPLKVWAYADFH